MSKSKTRLGLVGLCVTAVMAMMAFAASGAQAASWMVNGNNVEAHLLITVNVIPDTPLIMHTHASGSEVLIECETTEVGEAALEAGGKATGTVKFTECSTKLNGSPSAPCKPNEPIVAGGTLEVVKHEGETYIKATGPGGKFTTVTFGEECAIGEEFDVTGTGWIVDCEGWIHGEEEAEVHLIEEATVPRDALGGLSFGTEPAVILGSLIILILHTEEMAEFSALG